MIYTCIYNCKEGPIHHIEVKKYKSAPHVSTLHSERSWNFFKCESEVYDFMRNIQRWEGGVALSLYTYSIIDVYNIILEFHVLLAVPTVISDEDWRNWLLVIFALHNH